MTFKWEVGLLVGLIAVVTGCASLDTLRSGLALSKEPDKQSEKGLLNYSVAAAYRDFEKIRVCLKKAAVETPRVVKGRYEVLNGIFMMTEIAPLHEAERSELFDVCVATIIRKEQANFSSGFRYNPRFLKRTFGFNFTGTIFPQTEGMMVSDKYQFSEIFKD